MKETIENILINNMPIKYYERAQTREMLEQNPEVTHAFMELLTQTVTDVANGFFEYGVESEQIDAYVEDYLVKAGLKEKQDEEVVTSLPWSYLKNKVDWETFCDVTGASYYYRYLWEDTDTVQFTQSELDKLGL